MRSSLFTFLNLLPLSLAATLPILAPPSLEISVNDAVNLQERQLIPEALDTLSNVVDGTIENVKLAVAAGDSTALISALLKIQPTSRPSDIQDAVGKEASIWASPTAPNNFFAAVATQVASGLILDGTLKTVLNGGLPTGENSVNNANPPPPTKIFPKKDQSDAPYTVSEEDLRKAIYIPSGFTYGAKPPVLFVPGTGSYAGTCYAPNLRKLLTGIPFADPVWVNVPNAMLGDAQTSVEYIAYAINYISAVSQNSKNISVVAWSQGGLDSQWTLKYWPSTNRVVNNFFPISADFKGTLQASVVCLGLDNKINRPLCAPSVYQQELNSDFVTALKRDGGDSAYVPTTSFYSGLLDEVVQPQSGTGASAYMNDARGVGVLNVEVQKFCAGQLAGSFYEHAGVLYNPLTYALIVDAMTHGGPADPSRIDLKSVCSTYATPGLDLDDVVATLGLIPIAALLIAAPPIPTLSEPPLRPYVLQH